MICIDQTATIASASKLMREAQVDELLVTKRIAGASVPAGVISAHDIVVSVLGVELDPAILTVGDLLWGG
jgi:CBS domain-containing protein